METNVSCKKNRKGLFLCQLFSGTEDDYVYVEYLGEDAQFISELLIRDNVTPEGRRLRQQGTFECKLQCPKLFMICRLINRKFVALRKGIALTNKSKFIFSYNYACSIRAGIDDLI